MMCVLIAQRSQAGKQVAADVASEHTCVRSAKNTHMQIVLNDALSMRVFLRVPKRTKGCGSAHTIL